MEMAIGRLDLEKPETRPREDICTWSKAPGGDPELDSRVTVPEYMSSLREVLGLSRVRSHSPGNILVSTHRPLLHGVRVGLPEDGGHRPSGPSPPCTCGTAAMLSDSALP